MGKNKILLITLAPETHRTSEENLGIAYLKSSLVKNCYEVIIIDGWLYDLSLEEVYDQIIKNDNILFVGISSYMMNMKASIELIKKIKKYNSKINIVCGGFGPTFNVEYFLNNQCDFVIRGEGEIAIVKLANYLKNDGKIEEINNISYKKDNKIINNNMACLESNLDAFPFPARDTINKVIQNKSTVNMITSRGCSGNCEFCSVISFFRLSDGKVWRTRSINNIVDEIEYLYRKGIRYIKIVDDSFIDGIRDEEWCKNFADEIQKRNINVNLRGQIRADKINDDILYHLKRAGFFSFACGIENGSQSALTRMNKKATLIQNKKALELLKKHKYIVQMGFILFDPYTTLNELRENLLFLKKYDFAVTKGIFSEMFSAEGTNFNDKLIKNNKLIKGSIETNNRYLIEDKKVRTMYDLLKKWHKSHSYIYDMCIDPITAPKAISINGIEEFYFLMMELKKMDLSFFENALNIIDDENADFNYFVSEYIKLTKESYNNISRKLVLKYKKYDLKYNATTNPFI